MITVAMLTVAAGQIPMLAHSQVHLREMVIAPTTAASTMFLLSTIVFINVLAAVSIPDVEPAFAAN